jgi:hypothetical protein
MGGFVPPIRGGGAVDSVFGRTGVVVAVAGDYTAAQVTNAVSTQGSYADPSWITSLAWAKITGAPASAVASVFGRTGVVVAVAGDYTAAQVTNAVSTQGSYADPSWITSLAWAKITGVPPVSSFQSPWLSDINGGNFRLVNVSAIGVGSATPPIQQLEMGGNGVIAMATGNTTSYLTHQYLADSGQDALSLAVNFHRTSSTAGSVASSLIGTSEIEVLAAGGGAVSSMSFRLGPIGQPPIEKMHLQYGGSTVMIGPSSPHDQALQDVAIAGVGLGLTAAQKILFGIDVSGGTGFSYAWMAAVLPFVAYLPLVINSGAHVILGCPIGSPAAQWIPPTCFAFHLNEAAPALNVVVRMSDSSIRTGNIPLV